MFIDEETGEVRKSNHEKLCDLLKEYFECEFIIESSKETQKDIVKRAVDDGWIDDKELKGLIAQAKKIRSGKDKLDFEVECRDRARELMKEIKE